MYHVIGTGLTALLLYLLSYAFYRNKFYSKQFHQKLWNLILASAFILTALAGVFLALQINYKWNIPVIKEILKWHVELGAGLAITGLFHFLWHFSYYTGLFRKGQIVSEETKYTISTGLHLPVNLFIAGFISSSVQLLLLKEILNISGGYELSAGTFLASWLIGSATGSITAGKSKLSDPGRINLIFSLSPVISIIMMLVLARLYLKTGETPSFLAGIIFTFLILIPFCFVSGFTFIKLITAAGKVNNFIPGKSFSIETTGGIAAGIIISLFASGDLDTYKTLLLIIILGISYSVVSFYIRHRLTKFIFKIVVLAVTIFIILSSPDLFFRQMLMRGVKVTQSRDTQYGNITKAEYGGEISTYYDHRLLTYSNDVAEREEDIHYALLQHGKPENILLISGSLNSHLKEIAKYHVKKVVYVERDPELTKIEKPDIHTGSPELFVENDDAFSFVKRTKAKFDAAIVLLPPPSSLLLNRYYTIEFFESVKKSLNEGGVFACSPGINPNNFNKESINYYSSIYNSIKAVFKNIIPVSGGKLYFIASDSALSTSFCKLAAEKKIENVYVGPDYLSDDLIRLKTDEVASIMDPGIKINSSSVPVACFYYQSFSLSKNLNERVPALVLMIVLFLTPVITIRRNNLVMYFSASALAGFEIILLLILQLTIGNMYQLTGLIIAGIMTGLAAGTGLNIKFFRIESPGINVMLLAAFYVLAAVSVESIINSPQHGGIIILLTMAGFIPGLATGVIFRNLTIGINGSSTVSHVYYADLAGSAVGFIIFSGLIIPLAGIRLSLFLLPAFIITGFLFSLIREKQ